MPRIVSSRWLSCALVLWLCGSGALYAQSAQEPPSAAALDAARRQAEASAEPLRREWLLELDAAAAALQRRSDALDRLQAVKETAAQAVRDSGRLEQQLTRDPLDSFRQWQQKLPGNADGEKLETLLESERADMLRLRSALGEVADALASARAGGADNAQATAERQLLSEELRRRLGTPVASDSGPLLQAQAQRQRAELAALESESAAAAAEKQTAAVRVRFLELRQRQLQRDLGEREQRIEVLQAAIATRSDRDLATLVEDLRATEVEFAEPEGVLATIAADNRRLGEQFFAASEQLAARRRDAQRSLIERDAVAATLRNTRARLALDSQSDALGLVLLSEGRRLGNPAQIARDLETLRSELAAARLLQIDLAELRDSVADPKAAVDQLVGDEDSGDSAQRAVVRESLYRLLGTRGELLPRFDATLQRLVDTLEQAETASQQTLRDTRELRTLLDRQLFWIPNQAPVDWAWFTRQGAGWSDLLKPSRWRFSGDLLLQRLRAAQPRPIALLVLVAALFVLRRRWLPRIPELAPPWRRIREDRFRLSVQALLLSVGAALPWAVLLWGTGHLLRSSGAAGKFSDSLGQSLAALAASVFLLDLLRRLNIERGLLHAHFRWTRARRNSLSEALPWIAGVLLPIQFLGALAFARGVALPIDTAARLLLMLFALFCAGLLWRMLAPGRLWTPRGAPAHPQPWRVLLRIALPLLLLAIIGLLLSGYVYTGAVIMACLWQTLGTVVAVAIVHGLLARWFLLGERRLAQIRLEAARAEADSDERASGEALPVAVSEDLTLEKINAQTGRLLRALTLSLWVAGLLWVWADILPALGRLDDIALWHSSGVGDDGTPTQLAVTLRDGLLGALVLVLTFVAARNLPGLVELGLLSRISIDAPTRYAIASVSRYVIVIAGTVGGLGLLGVRWSQLQWMAAALTVGLGFGLQEIFANFVSGLILLFERPFRVGDVITIGDQSGTVSRIRTRATTLVDFDNKEIVIPNKTFITGQLINWTLTDSRTRVILRVGVDYGSDIEQVRQLLLEAASQHPLVLAEPAPAAWFMQFGNSSLDFELRVFVDTIGDRLPTTSQLNAKIAELFSARGIGFAYPHVDVNLRSLPEALRAAAAGSAAPAGPLAHSGSGELPAQRT